MSRNEKIIMGMFIGGIVLFLAISVVLLLKRENKNTLKNTPPPVIHKSEEVVKIVYPTIPPIENMTVMMNARRFSPQSFSIPVGGFVEFVNIAPTPITLEADNENSKIMDLGVIETSKSKTVTFEKRGTYIYRSKNNPKQIGTINIR